MMFNVVQLYRHKQSGALTLPANFVDANEQLPYTLMKEWNDALDEDGVC